jgi:hypothetical protein
LQKLNAPQENDDKLRELDGMFDDVKSVFDSTVFRLVGVVKLKEVLEDLEIVEDAVISQEMHHV